MENKLEAYIRENRESFDTWQPDKEVWEAISESIGQGSSPSGNAGIIEGWKKWALLGGMVLTGGLIFYAASDFNLFGNSDPSAQAEVAERPKNFAGQPPLLTDSASKFEVETPGRSEKDPSTSVEEKKSTRTVSQNKKIESLNAGSVHAPMAKTGVSLPSHLKNQPKNRKVGSYSFPPHPERLTIKSATETEKGSFSTTMDTLFHGIRTIEVEGGFCDISVESHDKKTLELDGSINIEAKGLFFKQSEYEIIATKEGSVLTVKVKKTKDGSSFLVGTKMVRARLNFLIPEKSDGISILTTTGEVSAKNIRSEKVRMETSLGDIQISGSDVTELHLTTKTGDIKTGHVTGILTGETTIGEQDHLNFKGEINLTTRTGDITLKQISGPVNLKTGIGDVQIEDLSGKLIAETNTGDISIRGCASTLTLTTGIGDIRVRTTEVTGNSSFTTNTGDINVLFLNDSSGLSFDLSSNSGDVKVKGTANSSGEPNKILIEKGPIRVEGRSGLGDQQFGFER